MVSIREMRPEDRSRVHEIIRGTGMFTEDEVQVAMELVDVYLNDPHQKDYRIFVAEGSAVSGYVCYGPTPAAEGTYDLYWIAVFREAQARGIGRALLVFTETDIRRLGGRLILIETSSQDRYRPTQQFYEKNGYILESRIKDYYRIGDDRLTYVKRLDAANKE